jgi:cholesterol oxidase
VGCNFGAKNSLDYTYLTAAWHAGADIRTRCEVRGFEPREGGGYAVHYVEHEAEAAGSATDTAALPRRTVTADRLVLAAGTLGTTYLLLRNRAALPALSPALGTHFSGNGDLLTFAVRCREEAEDGVRKPRILDPAFGPVITSAIRVPDAADGDGATGRGFYLQDAGFPEFGTWLLQAADTPGALARLAPGLVGRMVQGFLHRDPDSNLSSELASAFGDCGLSAGVLPLLGMGRDVPDGRMRLDGGRLQVDWRKHGASAEYFDRVRELSDRLVDQLGGSLLDNVLWHLNRVITVHALGGAPMGRTREEGVVDVNGEVFGHPGLHVADGSVMPGPVGANPSLTIAAVADRFADAILDGRTSGPGARSRPAAPAPPGGEAAAPGARAPDETLGVAFTEKMKGYVGFGESDPARGAQAGEQAETRCMFELTISVDDLGRFEADAEHPGRAEGVVRCDALGGERPVLRGWFNLFVGGRDKRMLYRLHLSDGEDHPVTLTGHKVVADDRGIDSVWADTSTLYTRLLAGHVLADEDAAAEVLAAGVLRIKPLDFARQLTTFDTTPDRRPDAVARFGALFAGSLWEVYGPNANR